MNLTTFWELKPNMIVVPYYKRKSNGRPVVVLNVTWKDLVNCINADHAGLHGFRGLWYWNKKRPLMNKQNFGKIEFLGYSRYWKYEIIYSNAKNLNYKKLKQLLGEL